MAVGHFRIHYHLLPDDPESETHEQLSLAGTRPALALQMLDRQIFAD